MIDKEITVAQIAKQAGVSPATVSRVLNHREQVKAGTIAKVEAAMEALKFVNSQKNDSVSKNQKLILLNVASLQNPFYSEVIQGALASSNARNYYLLVNQEYLENGTINHFCNLVKFSRASGVLLLNQIADECLDKITPLLPVVQCCDYTSGAGLSYVGINDFSAARNAVDYLLSAGKSKIAFINGPLRFYHAQERQKGYQQALEDAGIALPSGWIVNLPKVDYEMGFSTACQLLGSENRPDAFFTSSDILASAVIRAAKRFHLRVPEDIMVVGFDNRDISQMMIPSITTINQPKFQLGYYACEMLIEQIENPQSPARGMLLDTELIVRESTILSKG